MELNRGILFHDGTEQFLRFDEELNKYTFVLRTIKEFGKAYLVINGVEYEMTLCEETFQFNFYQTSIEIEDGLSNYHFKAQSASRTLFLNHYGPLEYVTSDGAFQITKDFATPDWAKGAVMYQIMVDRFCNGDKSNDVKSGEYAYIGKPVTAMDDWDALPFADGTRQFYGGDLQGVIDKLDYLEKLGIDVIYFNPIFVSPSNHKYDIQDYDYIDPHFGKIVEDGGDLVNSSYPVNRGEILYKKRTGSLANLEASNQLFIELVEKAHQHNIKVIIDGVFNHCGSFNKWLDREHLYKGNEDFELGAFHLKDSPYNSYFKFSNESWPHNGSYEGWWGFDTLPKLNYEGSEKLCDYIIEVAKKWVSPPFNVDGWRLDVAADLGHSEEFNHKFWQRFRKAVKEANKDAIILAEHYGDANSWLRGEEWDTVMNYDGFMDPVSFFLTGVDKHSDSLKPECFGDANLFNRTITYQMSRMQNKSLLVAMNELSNHDHSRFMTRTNKMVGRVQSLGSEAASIGVDEAIFKQGVIMQMTMPGAPTVYYGDEAGLCGWTDPDNRRTYPWGKENIQILEFYREAICLHKQNSALKTGSYVPLFEDYGILAYGRFDEKQALVTVVNTETVSKEIDVPVWELGVDSTLKKTWERLIETNKEFYNCGRIKVDEEHGYIHVKVPAQSAAVYRFTKQYSS